VTELPGVWRAVVADNLDPEENRRLTLQIPTVFGSATTGWANACLPPGFVGPLPEAGSGVWVVFEGADPARPVWIGTW
jgi:hypothetical protein